MLILENNQELVAIEKFMSILFKIRYLQFNSAWLRRLLALYYIDGKNYRVPFGPLRGFRLEYRSTAMYHAMIGIWEPRNIRVLKQVFSLYFQNQDDLVMCDIGANMGLYSLWFSKIAGSKGYVYAFEPVPVTARWLSNNVWVNHIQNVRVVEKACSDTNGTVAFYIGEHHTKSSFDDSWAKGEQDVAQQIIVQTTTLDEFFYAEKNKLPQFIKMDIEGGAVFALKGSQRLASECRPVFFIESHHHAEDRAIGEFMIDHSYRGYQVDQGRFITNLSETHPHPEGVWGTILAYPQEKHAQVTKILANSQEH